jgi:CheY-like chemotaxis protein
MRPLDLPDLSGLTLVIVDDDEDALELLRIMLKACGAHVVPLPSAVEALAYLETAGRVDALVTDLSMPDMDGLELVQRIRRRGAHPALPAIALTGFADDYTPANARGFEAFLEKPVNLERLCNAVRSAIAAGRKR